MLSAPPLPPPPAAVAISSSSSSCVFVADVPQDMAKEEEGSNVFASLMPNLFSRLQPCDDSITEQEFQDIHRLLTLEREKDDETDGLESSKKKPSPSGKSFYARGKENTLPSKLSQRNKLLRRESSSRITSHRKPFVVDLRSFGSILNNDALGECKKPQDVHAFWEAADEREASEAIMRKLRGGSESCSQKSVHGNSNLRRLGVRRKNSQRTTTRLRGFAVELPLSAEQVQSLDDEQLEEEEDATEESSFTFVSNPEFRVEKGMHEKQNIEKQVQVSQWMNPVQSDGVALEIAYMDKSAKMRDQAVDDQDILSDGKSPLIDTKGNGHPTFSQMTAASEDGPNEGVKSSHASEIVEIAPSNQVVETLNSPAAESDDRHVEKEGDVANEVDMKVTPYNRNAVTKSTPFTSPTPPSNPLAALGLRKDTTVEDIGKRRLDFDDTMNSPILEPDLPAPTIQNTPCLQNSSASPESPKTLVQEKSPELVEEINPISSDALPTEAIKSPEQNVTKPLKKTCTKRKRPLHDRRDSLKGAGTNWDDGVRRSTRIRSRPLEWWRGERFLLGRVHKSLSTVIGIKYSSPPPCWPKRGAKVPEFKVESYVPEKYAKYVQFAALY